MFPSSYNLSIKPPPPKYSDFTGYGWIIVTCSFILYFIVDGIAYNLGLVNSAWLAEFQQSETATSWIGSIFYSVPLLSAPITAQLVEKFGCKTITVVCSIISTFGFVVSSFCGSIEQLYVTVGLIAGFGVSAGYVVGILSAERWFEKNRTLAIGIVSSGTGFGTFLLAPITQRLLDAYGWRNVMYFLASLNVLMGVVGCFMREPQWVIDEMENKGVREPKKTENHGIFEEHETSFGTFRRLSIEAVEDIKDMVRGHFHDNYSHLEEVVEEKGDNFEKSEVILKNCEGRDTRDDVGSVKYPQNELNHKMMQNFEVRSTKSPENHRKTAEIVKNESKNQNYSQSAVKSVHSQNVEAMSLQSATVPQTNITSQQHTSLTHNIDHEINTNDSQERNNLETHKINDSTNSNTSSTANTSHKEIENETTVHLNQEKEENYQEESREDCEALTSGDNNAENSDECQLMRKSDLKSEFDRNELKSGEIFTICGQNTKSGYENVEICHQNLENKAENLENCENSGIDKDNFKLDNQNCKNDCKHHNLQLRSSYCDLGEHNLKDQQHNLKIGSQNCINGCKYKDVELGMKNFNLEEHNPNNSQHILKDEQNNLKILQRRVQSMIYTELKQQNGIMCLNSTEDLTFDQHNPKITNCSSNFSRSLQNLKPGHQNPTKMSPNHQQPPPYSQSCYIFQNSDIIPNKPDISAVIFKFIKEKFKVLKNLFSHFSNRDFTLLAISTFAIYSLYNIPIYFMVELLKTYDYTESQCANYISLIGISILVGMVTLGYVGDVSGNHVKNVNAFCCLACGIAEIILPNLASNSIAFGACCVFFGFTFASAYVLIPKIAEMIVGVEEFASAIGLNFFVQGLALLVGIPFASTIYEAIGSWEIAFEICGTIISFGSIFAFLVNVKKS